jgi:hypothetical protein
LDVPGTMATCEVVLGVFILGTWWRVRRKGGVCPGWRNRASLLALAFASAALVIAITVAAVWHFQSLDSLDMASTKRGWAALGAYLWLAGLMATGLLSLCGIVLAVLGKGSPRLAGAIWSLLVSAIFFVNLFFFVNAFH